MMQFLAGDPLPQPESRGSDPLLPTPIVPMSELDAIVVLNQIADERRPGYVANRYYNAEERTRACEIGIHALLTWRPS